MNEQYRFLLIRGAHTYAPEPLGRVDILITGSRVLYIGKDVDTSPLERLGVRVIEAGSYIAVPGFVDQHNHINGAGGAGGPVSRTPPVMLSELVRAGITSVVGLLGFDGVTRSLRDLLMKARALEAEGVSAWIYTGSYQVPPPTITGRIASDIALINEVIGVKISISDHRSSHPSVEELRKVASEARIGGLLGGKAGVVHVHVGTERAGLRPLLEAIEGTEIPIEQFAPTHLNRAEHVLEEAVEFGRAGGYVDITSSVSPRYGSKQAVKPSTAVKQLVARGVPISRITMSTDGRGVSRRDENGRTVGLVPLDSILEEFRDMVLEDGIPLEEAVRVVSTNIAEHLKLVGKGRIGEGYDADILLLDKDTLQLKYVVAKGEVLMENGVVIRRGRFE